MAVVIPVVYLVAVGVEEAIAITAGAAVLAGHALDAAFAQPDVQPGQEGGPGPQLPRMVTVGEEALAADIARRIDVQGDRADFLYDAEGLAAQQPEQDPVQGNTWAPIARAAAAEYRTITVAKTAIEAATIAAPGIAHVVSIQAQFPNAGGIIRTRLAALVTDANRLAASLATPQGTV